MYINKLKMNGEKTKCMIVKGMRREQNGNIILKCSDGILIERIQKVKYFDILVDNTSRLGDHCNYW